MKTVKSNRKMVSNRRLAKEFTLFKKNLQLTMLTLPAIIMIFVFSYVPLYGLLLPFKNYIPRLGIMGSEWVGLKNFAFLIKTGTIWRAVFNTISYNLVFLFVGVAFEVCIALMLYEMSRRVVKVYQTMLLVPHFLSWVVVAYIVNTLLDADRGVINRLLSACGGTPQLWYNDPKFWPAILVITNIWKATGYGAVVYLASLMGVDSEYFEAAKIDGATKMQQIFHISLPMLRPVITIMLILGIGKIMRGDFGLFYNVPMDSALLYPATDVIDTYVYRSLTDLSDIGMSSTTGFAQSIFGFLLVLSTNLIVNKMDPDNALF